MYRNLENSIFIGKIAKYRRLIEKGYTPSEAAKTISKAIISEETEPDGILRERYEKTEDAVKSFAAHIRRMDDVVAGSVAEEKLHENEKVWYGILPY